MTEKKLFNSLKRKCFGRDIPGTSRTHTPGYPRAQPWMSRQRLLRKVPSSFVLDRSWPGCPAIWVGTSRDEKNFMQENFGLTFFVSREKGINIKNFARNPRPRPPSPSKGSLQNTGKGPNIKNFFWGGGGGLRGPKILYAEILYVFDLRLRFLRFRNWHG